MADEWELIHRLKSEDGKRFVDVETRSSGTWRYVAATETVGDERDGTYWSLEFSGLYEDEGQALRDAETWLSHHERQGTLPPSDGS